MAAGSLHFSVRLHIHKNKFQKGPSKSNYFSKPLSFPPLRHSNPVSINPRRFCVKTFSGDPHFENSNLPISRSRLVGNAGMISVATLISKILGLLREMVIAAVFGVGPVASAFKHALVLPSFFTSLLGGVNGPIHITAAITLSKLSTERRGKLVQNAHAALLLIGGILGASVYIFADSIIYLSAPGLWASEGHITKEIAINQLKLMTPCILFAGPVGLGFGSLSAAGDNVIPSLSPALSSITIILSCAIYISSCSSNSAPSGDSLSGGLLISCGASLGVFLQWLIQAVLRGKAGNEFRYFSWKSIIKDKHLFQLFALVLPAILTSGLAQIASFTDLYFASFIPGAAAGLSYARLLAMAPLGILLNTVILPRLPTFSRLEKQSSWPTLKENLQQTIILCVALVFAITSSTSILAEPIVKVLFQRFAFDSASSAFISSLFICYSIGSPFYIVREMLVMVFYALGDGQQPFYITLAAILLNALLDWLFMFKFHLGAQGLVLATSGATALSTVSLLYLLSRKLEGLIDFKDLVCPLLLLLVYCTISGCITLNAYKTLRDMLSPLLNLRFSKLYELLSISLAVSLGVFAFFIPLVLFQVPKVKLLKGLLRHF